MAKMLTVELTQQTPMIHFQYAEPGATIRGSELKPKLDRFLIQILGDKIRIDHPQWFASQDQDSLAYKVRIRAQGKPTISANINKSYFGNLGDSSDCQSVEYADYGVDVTFYSALDDLIVYIRRWIKPFFWLHNFGTRQSKGFGSFSVWAIDGERHPEGLPPDPDSFLRMYYKSKMHMPAFEIVCANETPKWMADDVLEQIRVTYGFMKSGFNFPNGDYYKGFALQYLTPTFANDKAFVKSAVLGRGPLGKPSRFIRAMLGVSDQASWYSDRETIHYAHAPRAGEHEIKRVPSPILFSVTENGRIFVLPHPIPNPLRSTDFSIWKDRGQPHSIKTPSREEFDFSKFLTDFATKFNDKNGPWCQKRGGGSSLMTNAQDKSLQIAQYLTMRAL